MRKIPDLATLRGAWWAHTALIRVRRQLAGGDIAAVSLSAPPPQADRRGVEALLRRRSHSCLEAALVRQRWLGARGVPRDVVIGVTAPAQGFLAHAWLDGEDDPGPQRFAELSRIAPR